MSVEDTVRPARATDAAAIGTVRAAALRAEYAALAPPSLAGQRCAYRHADPPTRVHR